MRTILLIRHGESKANAGTDEPSSYPEATDLTEKGWQQAKAIAAYLKSESFPDLIITSSFKRAAETAWPAVRCLPSVDVEEWDDVHEFTYLCSKCLDRHLTSQQQRLELDVYWNTCSPFSNGCRKPSPAMCPQSESFAMFIRRAQNVLLRLKQMPYETIALFSHEQFIRALLWIAEGKAPLDHEGRVQVSEQTMMQFRNLLRENRVPNGAIIRVQVSGSEEHWHSEMITSHVEALAPVAALV